MKRILSLAGVAFSLLVPLGAEARLTKFVVTKVESPTFGGYSWPGVGQYEKIIGVGFGEVNPSDAKNSVMVDIQLAPRNANGNVEYNFDFYILKPINLKNGAHKVMYEPPNRGGKTWSTLARFPGGNDPGSVTDAATLANAFFMPRGYTIAFSGWDQAAPQPTTTNLSTAIRLPVAHNPDGSAIAGPGYDYIVTSGGSFTLTYPAATLDQSKATLTHRVHLDDTPNVVPVSGWKYNSASSISLTTGNFVGNDIYEFMYTATNPTVNTVGLAAIRDFNAWLRYERRDDVGTANPLAGDIQRIYTEVVSQPGRTLNDFRHLGFNQAENGKQVFDGMVQWIAAGDGLSMNFRFSQPGRTERNRQEHLFNEATFPFANVTTFDPISGKTDSRLAKCEASHTCPRSMEIYSSNEYWVKAASLLHTTPDGKHDLDDSPFARDFLISSHQHGTGSATSKGACQQFQNPLNSAPVQRALWIALDEWVTEGKEPPHSRVPTFHDGTLVPVPAALPNGTYMNIPGTTYTGLKTTRYRFNWGPGFYDTGIATFNPPLVAPPMQDNPRNGPIYPSFVPKVNSDGNDIPGVYLADVTVPVATYTGWALRAGQWANDGCEGSGQYIPFAKTAADRLASGDPRPSVAERYDSLDDYTAKVAHALGKMIHQRLLLCEDYDAELNRLVALGSSFGLAPDTSGKAPKVPAIPKQCTKAEHGPK
jgi:Alpha/beta hydrolase domain